MAANPGLRLELRQGQNLVMTTQLQQSIKLLQMSATELADFLETEVERNPLLMMEGGEEARDAAAGDAPEMAEAAVASTDSTPERSDERTEEQASDWLDVAEEDFWHGEAGEGESSPWDHASGGPISGGGGHESEDINLLEATVRGEVSLQEHLMEQLALNCANPAQRVIGLRLIEQLDEAGYLSTPLEEIATPLGCAVAEVDTVLETLQGFDPPGIFARSLAECLALQLKDKNRYDPAMATLLQHLDLLAAGKMEALRKHCGVDAEDLADMITEIRTLNPKPGSGFARDASQLVIPDVLLRRGSQGGWVVELNAQALPRLLVNRRYLSQLQQASTGKEERHKQERKYLSDQLATANWLMKALDQRAQTLLKVGTEIVAQQDGFFRHGVTHLRPMTLKMIAEAVQVHESTVSRVTTNKFIGTHRGLFELKYFFTSALAHDEGEGDISSRAVQHYIKELIAAEKPEAVLSDDAIAAALQDRGISVARRTVAKYRDLMKIGSSAERRRAKRAAS